MTPRTVEIWTDGGCNNKTGIGAWAAVIMIRNPDGTIYVAPDGRQAYREISGGEVETTSSRMELMAAIMALKALTGSCKVRLTTDSQYLQKGMNEWMDTWKRRGWKTADGKPVVNKDLWEQLNFLRSPHTVTFEWTRGHNGDEWNERCDQLCTQRMTELKASI